MLMPWSSSWKGSYPPGRRALLAVLPPAEVGFVAGLRACLRRQPNLRRTGVDEQGGRV